MNNSLNDRLNQILPRITSDAFLSNEGIGNEIACYIFDYAAEDELVVRDHVVWMKKRISTHYSGINVIHLDLLDVVVAYLKKRDIFDKTIDMQATKGDAAALRALNGPLSAERLCDFIATEHNLADHDLLLLTGVGSVWPMIRAHSLLNCMHSVVGQMPLLMFYPGTFDGTTLRLFGQFSTSESRPGSKHYYRAFVLVP